MAKGSEVVRSAGVAIALLAAVRYSRLFLGARARARVTILAVERVERDGQLRAGVCRALRDAPGLCGQSSRRHRDQHLEPGRLPERWRAGGVPETATDPDGDTLASYLGSRTRTALHVLRLRHVERPTLRQCCRRGRPPGLDADQVYPVV